MPLDKVSPLPRPATGRITTPTTSGPDGPPAQAAPLQRLANALGDAAQPERQAALAEDLLSRLDGGHLSLRWMEGADRDAVYSLPAKAWALLNAACPGGVHTVDLPTPRDNQQLGRVIDGLNQLTGLRAIHLPVPETGVRIHLHELAGRDETLTVRLDCWRPAGWRVTAPAGLRVTTSGVATRLAHSIKPTAQRADRDGKAQGRARALEGIVYFHQPKDHQDFTGNPQDPRAWAGAQDHILATNLNALASFPESKSSKSATGTADAIACRHLALQWLADRDSATGVTYGHYATAEDIQHHVNVDTETQFDRLRRMPATALVHIDRFGEALHQQFAAMKPGERRQFLIGSATHAMALELQSKPARGGEPAEYVVAFYDPNVTLSHERVALRSLDAVKPLSLRTFLGGKAEAYFDPSTTLVAQLYRVDTSTSDAQAVPSAERLVGLSAQVRREPGFLHQIMRAGYSADVVTFVREALDDKAGHAARTGQAGVLGTSGDAGAASALIATLSDGHPDTPAAYVAALLDTRPSALTSDDRHALLTHAYAAPGSVARVTPMVMALWARPTATAAMVRCLLGADRDALSLAHAMDILGGTAATGRPPLATVAGLSPCPGGTREGIRQSLYNFVHEVVRATRLPDDDKLALVAARTPGRGPAAATLGPSAAAQALQRDAPAVAASMLCAVLEAPATQALRQSLLKALDVDLGSLLSRLASSSEPDAPDWLRRIVAGLPDAGLPVAMLEVLLAPYVAQASAVVTANSPQVRSLLQADTVAGLDGTTHGNTDLREAGLRALRLDSNPSLMLCTAEREIAGLEGFRLASGTLNGPQAVFEGIRYLLPLARLRPVYECTAAAAQNHPWVDAQGTRHTALLAGQMLQHTDDCLEHVSLALDSPKGPQDDLALRRWLLSRPLNEGPMLHAMATSPTSHAPAGKRAQAIHDFIRAVVRSDRLSVAEQGELLRVGHPLAGGGFGTAAQAAIAANRPDAAAAMACAILESGRPAGECVQLLRALGVPLTDTLRAPGPGQALEPDGWTARVLNGVQTVGLPQEDIVLPVLLRAGELGLGLKLSSKTAPRADHKHGS